MAQTAPSKNVGRDDQVPRLPNPTWYLRPEWWAVLFAAVLCGITYFQWRVARDTITDARQSFQIGNRAYVTLTHASVKSAQPLAPVRIPSNGKPVQLRFKLVPVTDFNLTHPIAYVEVKLSNTGNTPALRVHGHLWVAISNTLRLEPTSSELAAEVPGSYNPYVLAKDGDSFFGEGTYISDSDFEAIRASKKFLTAYGYVEYEDVFGWHHRTRYCNFYIVDRDDMGPCYKGNDMY